MLLADEWQATEESAHPPDTSDSILLLIAGNGRGFELHCMYPQKSSLWDMEFP